MTMSLIVCVNMFMDVYSCICAARQRSASINPGIKNGQRKEEKVCYLEVSFYNSLQEEVNCKDK